MSRKSLSASAALSAADLIATPAGALTALSLERDKELQRGERGAARPQPDLSAPWIVIERAASKMRIRALARVLDPSALLDDDAVEVGQ